MRCNHLTDDAYQPGTIARTGKPLFRREVPRRSFCGEQNVPRLFDWDAARKIDFAARTFWILQLAAVCALKNYFERARFNSARSRMNERRSTRVHRESHCTPLTFAKNFGCPGAILASLEFL